MSAIAQVPDVDVASLESVIPRRGWETYGLGRVFVVVFRWMHSRSCALLAGRASRRLSVTETVSLGEKRFVSILCVDGEQFLVGGSSSNVVLLAKLEKCLGARSSATTVSETFSGLISRAGGQATAGIRPRFDDDGASL